MPIHTLKAKAKSNFLGECYHCKSILSTEKHLREVEKTSFNCPECKAQFSIKFKIEGTHSYSEIEANLNKDDRVDAMIDDLSKRVYVHEIDVIKQDFRKIDFYRRDFTNCEFKSCNFEGVYLRRSHFNNCKFINCNFSGSHFSYSSVNDSVVSDCNFKNAVFISSDILSCDVKSCDIDNAEMNSILIDNCKISDVSKYNTTFKNITYNK